MIFDSLFLPLAIFLWLVHRLEELQQQLATSVDLQFVVLDQVSKGADAHVIQLHWTGAIV
jgi:hypothetical protein